MEGNSFAMCNYVLLEVAMDMIPTIWYLELLRKKRATRGITYIAEHASVIGPRDVWQHNGLGNDICQIHSDLRNAFENLFAVNMKWYGSEHSWPNE